MLRALLAVAAVASVTALASAPAGALSGGACVLGICTAIPPVPDPVPIPVSCLVVATPALPPLLGEAAVLLVLCP